MDYLDKYKKALTDNGEVYIRVKARPGAGASVCKGVLSGEEETVKIDVAAAPERGKANIELIGYLSGEFEVPKSRISIISGAGDKTKLIKIKMSS